MQFFLDQSESWSGFQNLCSLRAAGFCVAVARPPAPFTNCHLLIVNMYIVIIVNMYIRILLIVYFVHFSVHTVI